MCQWGASCFHKFMHSIKGSETNRSELVLVIVFLVTDKQFQAWGKHVKRQIQLKQPEKSQSALHCLNELVTDALRHIPDCIKYMNRLHNQSVFNFCAIPQVQSQV